MRTGWNLLNRYLSHSGDLQDETEIILEAKGVSFAYNGRPILTDIDLRLRPGQMVGLIGPNGAGKSTLVKVLCRLLRPQAGQVTLAGRDLACWRRDELARHLAVVPQAPFLPETFTAWEVVLLGRTPYLGLLGNEDEGDMAVARWAMQETEIWHLAPRFIGQLSGGERQRVIIARALAQEPRVLLMDEPTAHLDINHQVEVLTLTQRLTAEYKLAVLAIFHNLNLAARFCEDLVLLREGRVFAQGTPHQVLTPSNIAAVYGTEVIITPHPQNGRPAIFPL